MAICDSQLTKHMFSSLSQKKTISRQSFTCHKSVQVSSLLMAVNEHMLMNVIIAKLMLVLLTVGTLLSDVQGTIVAW